MVTYPIHIARKMYSGVDPRKRAKAQEQNRIADALEKHINKLLYDQADPIVSYNYMEIAMATGYGLDVVRTLCFSIDAGHGGFTAVKRGMTVDDAIKAHSHHC